MVKMLYLPYSSSTWSTDALSIDSTCSKYRGASANQVSHRTANQVLAKDVWHSNTCVNWSWAVIYDYEVSCRVCEHMTNDQLFFTFRMCRDPFILRVYLSHQFTGTVIILIKAKMQNKLAFQGQMLYIAGGGDFSVIPSGMGSSP